jgi:hypothetical protein
MQKKIWFKKANYVFTIFLLDFSLVIHVGLCIYEVQNPIRTFIQL